MSLPARFMHISSKIKSAILDHCVFLIILLISSILHLIALNNIPSTVFTDEIDPFVSVLSLISHHGLQLSSSPLSPLNLIIVTLNLEWESIFLFGTSTFSIRFPGFVFSTILILFTYLLTLRLFSKRIANFTVLLVGFSPLVIQGSRVFYQIPIIASDAIIVSSLYIFYLGTRNELKSKYIVLSSVLLAFDFAGFFNIYSRILSVSLLLVLILRGFLINRSIRNTEKVLKLVVIPSIIFMVSLIPALFSIASSNSSVHSPSFYFSPSQNLLLQGLNGVWIFIEKYVSYFSPQFLFVTGDVNPTQNTGLTGEMLYPSFFFFYFGLIVTLYRLFTTSEGKTKFILPLYLILMTPIEGAASTIVNYTDSSNAILLVPWIQIIAAIGIDQFLNFVGKDLGTIRITRKEDHLRGRVFPKIKEIFPRSKQPSKQKTTILIVIIVLGYSVSGYIFSYDYFVVHNIDVEDNPPNWADWGYLYGFPQIAEYINKENLTNLPIYVSPSGMFQDNLSTFYYFYNVQHIPTSYLDYYTDGKVSNVSGVINVSNFFPSTKSLIISGSAVDLENFTKAGVVSKMVYEVKRPNGKIALVLIEAYPMLTNKALREVYNYTIAAHNITGETLIKSNNLTTIGNNFSAELSFMIPNLTYTPNRFYNIMLSDPINNEAPRFGFRISSLSYSPSHGSNTTMTFNSFLYTNNNNYSTVPGAFTQIWSGMSIYPNVVYTFGLAYQNNQYMLYENGSPIGSGYMRFPLIGMSSNITLDGDVNANIASFYEYSFSLSGSQMVYLFRNGFGI